MTRFVNTQRPKKISKYPLDSRAERCYTLTVLRQVTQLIQTIRKGGTQLVNLNYRDSRPIYEQLRDGYRELLISGAISPGERLPSVRELATQLAINPNTIQRAYRELESEGYIYSVPGKGAFAASRSDVSEGRKSELLGQLNRAAAELKYLGVSEEELCAIIKGAEKK